MLFARSKSDGPEALELNLRVYSDVTAVLGEFNVPCGVWLYCLSQKNDNQNTIKTSGKENGFKKRPQRSTQCLHRDTEWHKTTAKTKKTTERHTMMAQICKHSSKII